MFVVVRADTRADGDAPALALGAAQNGRTSGSFHEANGDAEDESGTHLGHMGSEGDLRRAIRLAVAEFITADMVDAAHLGLP